MELSGNIGNRPRTYYQDLWPPQKVRGQDHTATVDVMEAYFLASSAGLFVEVLSVWTNWLCQLWFWDVVFQRSTDDRLPHWPFTHYYLLLSFSDSLLNMFNCSWICSAVIWPNLAAEQTSLGWYQDNKCKTINKRTPFFPLRGTHTCRCKHCKLPSPQRPGEWSMVRHAKEDALYLPQSYQHVLSLFELRRGGRGGGGATLGQKWLSQYRKGLKRPPTPRSLY